MEISGIALFGSSEKLSGGTGESRRVQQAYKSTLAFHCILLASVPQAGSIPQKKLDRKRLRNPHHELQSRHLRLKPRRQMPSQSGDPRAAQSQLHAISLRAAPPLSIHRDALPPSLSSAANSQPARQCDRSP